MRSSSSVAIAMSWLSCGEIANGSESQEVGLTHPIRILLQEDEYGRDDELAVFCARLSHVQRGWRLVRLLNMKGNASGATLLINLSLEE